ncbi:MAG: B12-binding domain-containing radical SAM protein [Candidatus Tectomicrobia bacterium]|nr:B12-binding domain-containing radical SAM protein [Candidatus Tectomicrobia bacterium]
MRILLIMPIVDRGQLWGKVRYGAGNNNFNYGLASIAAYLIKHGHVTEIIDPQFMSSVEELTIHMRRREYEVVGISAHTPTIMNAFFTAKVCRTALPEAVIVMGGPHCTYFPGETLKACPELDYVISREGEDTLLQLVRMLEAKRRAPEMIQGLTYRDDSDTKTNPPPPFLDVNELPPPAYHLFPFRKYSLQPTIYKRLPTVTTMISRGCPFSCSFCHGFETLGRKMRYRDVDLIIEELQILIKDYGARGFMFYDSTFTLNQHWVMNFCEEILRRKLGFTWMCLTRSDCVTPDLLSLMRRAGCWGISFGVESGNQKSLDLLKKNTTIEDNRRAISIAKNMGIYVTATYMIALPGEDEKDALRTIEFARNNSTHIAHFFWPVPYPKTLFYEQCKEDGGLMGKSGWENYNLYAEEPVYINPRIGYARMRQLQRYAIRSYYTSWKVLQMNLKSITTWTDVCKYSKAALAVAGNFI